MELAYFMHHLLSEWKIVIYFAYSRNSLFWTFHSLNQYHFLAEIVFERLRLYKDYIWKTLTLFCF